MRNGLKSSPCECGLAKHALERSEYGQWAWTYVGEDCCGNTCSDYGLVLIDPHAEILETDPNRCGDDRIHGRLLLVLRELRVLRGQMG